MEQNNNKTTLKDNKQDKSIQTFLKAILVDKEYQEEANRHLVALYKLCKKKRKRSEVNINKIESDSSSSDVEIICKFEKKPRREEIKEEAKSEQIDKSKVKIEVKKEEEPICNICLTNEGNYLLKPICCSYEMHMDCAVNYMVTNKKDTCPQCKKANFFGDRYGNLVNKNNIIEEEILIEEDEDNGSINNEEEIEEQLNSSYNSMSETNYLAHLILDSDIILFNPNLYFEDVNHIRLRQSDDFMFRTCSFCHIGPPCPEELICSEGNHYFHQDCEAYVKQKRLDAGSDLNCCIMGCKGLINPF